MSTLVQRSFAGGEISPFLYARVDVAKYATGLRTCRNMLVMRHGGAQNRAGSQFIQEVKDSTKSVRLLPFVFNSDQTYVLEFGDQYIRVIKDGVQLTEAAQSITGITQANPGVVTINSHGYSNGDEVFITGVDGMVEVNVRNFKVNNVTANTFELQTMDGVDLDTSAYTAYTSGGTAAKIYEIVTPYLEADLDLIKYAQSADVITLVHPSYAPRELARTGDTAWTLSAIDFSPEVQSPTNIDILYSGGGGTATTRYMVTAVDRDTGEESLIGTGGTGVITGATQALPCVITSVGHGLVTGSLVTISGVSGMTELNGNQYIAVNLTANTFHLIDFQSNLIDSTGFGAYTSGGSWVEEGQTLSAHAALSTSNVATIEWNEVPNASEYNIYKEADTNSNVTSKIYGFTGISRTNTFRDIGIDADTADNPTLANDPFDAVDSYPSTVTFVQQRRVFANTNDDPERVWLSRIGNFRNFTSRSPIQADDPINFILAGRQVNAVKHLIDAGQLLTLTSGGEWSIQGDPAGIITPTDVNPKQYGYNGSSDLPPLVLGGNVLYVQARGSVVRDLAFDFQVEGYRGNDLTIFSSHLFDEYTLKDWTFQQIPHSIVWIARDDGTLLGLTYVREHEMWAWHRHDFDGGQVENVISVPEGAEDSLYLVIKRTVDGRTTRYVERFNSRQVDPDAIEDSIFVDSSISYNGQHTGSTTMTLTGGTDWTFGEELTLTASAGTFDSSYIGNQIHLHGADGTEIRFTVDSFTSSTVVKGRPNKTVPVAMRSVALGDWAYALKTVTGLWHIEGKEVSVFADGFVVANPNNAAYDQITVANGQITLDKPYSVIHVGLPFISDIETLDIDTPQGETLADKSKRVNTVNMFVEKSRGIFAGAKPPTDDAVDPLEDLYELKIRDDETMDQPVALATGIVDIKIKPEWNTNGRVFIRQVDPVPLAVLAVAPAGLFPFRG